MRKAFKVPELKTDHLPSKCPRSHLTSGDNVRVLEGEDSEAASEEEVESELDGNYEQQRHEKSSSRCLLYTSPSPRDATLSRMPSSA